MKRRLGAPSRAWVLGSLVALAVLAIPLPANGAEVPANGRVWERVTPSEPTGASPAGVIQLEKDDSRIIYLTLGPMPGAASGFLLGTNLAERGRSGWSSAPFGFPYSAYSEDLFEVLLAIKPVWYSEDRLTSLWTSTVPLTPGAPPEGHAGLYLLLPDGSLTLIAGLGKKSAFEVGLSYMSGDSKKVFFASSDHLLPGDAGRTEGESIYEWDATGLRQVDVGAGGSLLSACGSTVTGPNKVSVTSTRVFFVNPAQSACSETKRVYLREAGGTTTEVSASQCTRVDCNSPQKVAFAGATPSGEHAYLTTTQQLTNDDVDGTRDLYRYDVDSGELTLLTVAQPEAEGEASERAVFSSADGSRVYFKASGRLVTGEGPTSGENLYLADQSGLHFVAPILAEGRVELAREGRSALFETVAGLIEGDSDLREDVYLFNADDSTYTLLSIGPIGGNGPFGANIKAPLEQEEQAGELTANYHSISEDGQDAFFTTTEKLVPEDVNEAADVYEWKAGRLGLVSSGTATNSAEFGGINADGRTALFKTTAALTPDDLDGGDADLYVARIGGGFPAREVPSSCEGSACEGAKRASLARPLPGTATSSARRKAGRIKLRSVCCLDSKSGELLVTAVVPSPGRVSAFMRVPGGDDKPITLARGSEGAIRPGKVRVVLRLTSSGRRMLARQRELSGKIVVRAADQGLIRPVRLPAEVMK